MKKEQTYSPPARNRRRGRTSLIALIATSLLLPSASFQTAQVSGAERAACPTGCASPQDGAFSPLSVTTVPLAGLQAALSAAQPGDTLLVEAGTYADTTVTLTYDGPGPVTVRAEEDGAVVFSGQSLITIKNSRNLIFRGFLFDQVASGNSLVLDGSSHVEVTQNYFYQNGNSPTSKIVGIRNGSAHNKIHHNTFDRSKGQSVALYNGHTPADVNNTRNEIYNNLFYRIPRVSDVYPGNSNGLEAVQLGQGREVHNVFHTKVRDNLFEGIIGDGGEIVSVKSSGNDISRNTFRDNASGLTIRLGDNNRVKDNYFENTEKGIRTYGYGQSIKNNYLVGGMIGIQLPAADTAHGQNPTVAAPYYQSEASHIKGNVIVNPVQSGMVFGANYNAASWNLLPIDNDIRDNRIYIANLAKDYVKNASVASFYDPLADFRNNISYLRSAANAGNISPADSSAIDYVYTDQPSIPTPESVTGAAPYESLDIRTGASWRRPVEPEPPAPVQLLFDFEDFAAGPLNGQQGWTNAQPQVTVVENVYASSGAKAVQIVDPDTTTAYGAIRRFDPIVKGTIEWRAMAKNRDRLVFRMEDTTVGTRNVEWIGFFYDGTFEYQNGATRTRTAETFRTDTWYRFVVDFDGTEARKTIRIYEGDSLLFETETPFENVEASGVSLFRFTTVSNRSGTFYVDDVRITESEQ